jgi:hypothetical protein
MVYTKKRLAFSNQAVFEKKFSSGIDACYCVVSKMMFENLMNVDGTISHENAGSLRKSDLWSYIYYLFYYNNSSVEEFVAMKDKKNGKASAIRFYEVVKAVVKNQFVEEEEITPLDVNTLIYFVNIMIERYEGNMSNPIVSFVQQLVHKAKGEQIGAIKKLSIVTGDGVVNSRSESSITNTRKISDIETSDIRIDVKNI